MPLLFVSELIYTVHKQDFPGNKSVLEKTKWKVACHQKNMMFFVCHGGM